MNGLFIIDKPSGMTSHDVVQTMRKKFDAKAGHLGTLDPMATGVLPICVGKATRMGQFFFSSPKVYTGAVRFGWATDTYDREGSPTTEARPVTNSKGEIEEALRSFIGAQNQTPPPYSAKKIGGVASHKLARRGQQIDMAPVRIDVYEFQVTDWNPPMMTFRLACSAGTYVRSLAQDLGQRLGCGAHLDSLRRVQSGEFTIERATRLDAISESDLIPMESLLDSFPRIEVTGGDEMKVVHGNQIPMNAGPGLARIFNKKGEFIAVAALENGWAHPRVVLTSVNSDRSNVLACNLEKEIET
jgi:tRNA pseudouridine55 synthase